MPVNPLISLSAKAPDVGTAFSNTLLNISNIDKIKEARDTKEQRDRLLEAKTATLEAGVPTPTELGNEAKLAEFQSIALGASEIVDDLRAGRNDVALQKIRRRKERLIAEGKTPEQMADTLEAEQLAQANPKELLRQSENAIALFDKFNPQRKASAGLASAKTEILESGATIQALPSGEVVVKDSLGNTVTGEARNKVLQENRDQKQRRLQQQADRTVQTAGRTEEVKQKQQRISAVKKKLSQRNRDAARASRTTRKALVIAQQSSQGLSGAAKLQLSRLLPGIDSSDEALLDSTLKQLALEQLQNFKGPTTDFEFGVTESIAGSLGQSKEANIARIKSLDRANWFNQREFQQFDKFVKSGGDPDTFRFNFGEPIKTKKGIFTLQDIQDTAVQNNLTIEETIERLNK